MGAANVASGSRPPGRSSSFPRPCAFPFFARGVELGHGRPSHEREADEEVLGQRRRVMADERERARAGFQQSLTVFAGLRDQMHKNGPKAVVDALAAMPEGDLRQLLFALVVTAAHAEDGEQR